MGIFNWKRARRVVVAQRPTCAECGYREIEAHAMLSWSETLQDWQIVEVREHGSCSGCGNTEAKISWQDY